MVQRMRREDFYTGEPLPNGSPPFLSEFGTEAEAIENASFGKYDYDPGNRMMNNQPITITPGGYGYNNPVMGGIGMPMMSQMNYQMNNYNYGYGNPALAYQQQQQMMYMQQQQQSTEVRMFIPPINFSSDYLPSAGFEEEIERMKLEYWAKEQEAIGRESVDRQMMNPYGGFQNYYGVPFYNPYQYNAINNEIANRAEQMKREARENRISLNMKLSKLAHSYLKDGVDDKAIEEMYTGKEVVVPVTPSTVTIHDIYLENKLRNLVPFNNAPIYNEMDLAVSRSFNRFIPEDANMQQTFENMGVVAANYVLEEEQHRRRNGAVLYNSDDNSYKYFVRRKAAERHAQKTGMNIGNNMMTPQSESGITPQSLMSAFPTLNQTATLTDDGTLNITCNFGSRAGQTYSVHNSQESRYNMDKERFHKFIDSIPGSIYLNNPNQKAGE